MLQPDPHQLASLAPRHEQIELGDGTRLHYADHGSGMPVLLVHGWAASGAFFDDLAAMLAADMRVIVPDLRAHGDTACGQSTLTIDRLADDMAELIAALELDSVVVLGWSMGAMVLWRMLLRHDHRAVAGMVVEDMSPRVLNSEDWPLGMSNGLDVQASARAVRAMRSDWTAYAEAFTPRIFSRDRLHRDPEMIAWSRDRIKTLDSDAMAALWSSMTALDLRSDLPAIKTPTLVIYGERSDAYGPETSRYLVETLPNASKKGFAHSGHAPHMEETEEFARAVLNFARLVQPGSKHSD
ncbi:MAG: alpha/beta hydrolase [Alphaproteobacteria bacterium]|nr:alpha/beta hydrolase [Alphaproteobacteria bacterium]